MDAIALLMADHRQVEHLFKEFAKARAPDRKAALVRQICTELTIHTTLEEEIFYPSCKGRIEDETVLDEAYLEHDGAKFLIGELLAGTPDEEFFEAKVAVLADLVKDHVKDEERRSKGLFAQARKAGLDGEGLGERLNQRKQTLKAKFGNSSRA